MRLSSDGLTLLKVDNEDLTRGAFIVPHGVTTIGIGAFFGCTRLTQLTIPHGVTTIGRNAFAFCYGLTQITIPNSVTTIGAYAFSSCRSLTQVTIPHSVTTIDAYAFALCYGLTQITIPNSVTTIGAYAFTHSGLTKITLAGGQLTTIDPSAFDGCNIQEIVVNTDDDREIERIKNLLPVELRDKVIKNPVYHEVIKFQEETLRPVLLRDAPLRGLTNTYHQLIFSLQKLPTEIISLIVSFDEDTNNHVNNKIYSLGFPVTNEAFEQYKLNMPNVLDEMRQRQTIVEIHWSCAMELQKYVDDLQTSKQEKRHNFFAGKSDLLGQIERKLDVTEKIIRWLIKQAIKGSDHLIFLTNIFCLTEFSRLMP